MVEFVVTGKKYRSGKMDAFKQFHVGRRLAPVMATFAELVKSGSGVNPMEALPAVADALSNMTDADADYVLYACLCVVEREVAGTSWGKVALVGSGIQYDDIEMPDLLNIVFHVLKDNFSSFSSALPQNSL